MIVPYCNVFCRAYSPLFFIHSNPQRCAGLSARLHWANFLRGFQPLCPYRADISFWLTAPLPLQGRLFYRAYSPLVFIYSNPQGFRRRRLVLRSLGVGGRLWRTRRGLPRRNEMKPGLSGRLHWANFLRGLQPLCPCRAVFSSKSSCGIPHFLQTSL